MYKKILERIVEKEMEHFISEKFEGKNFYAFSKHTKLTQDKEYKFVRFEACVLAYYEDDEVLPDIYDLKGLVHDSGIISVTRVNKRYQGPVMQFDINTKQLEFV